MPRISRDGVNKINLDGSEAVQSLKSLRAEISSTTAEMKAQVATLKASGDALGSAKAHYDGLSSSIDKQKNLLTAIKSSMDNEAQATSKNSDAYARLERQYNSAQTKLISLTNQQEKAKNSLEYQQSGLAKLNDQLKSSSSLTDSYVNVLKAQGRESEAIKAQIGGLAEQQSKLRQIYSKQVDELNRLKNAEGDNAEAINRQTVRVNETAAKMAHATSEAKDLREQFSKRASNSFLSGIASGFDNYNEKVQKAKERTERFKDIIGGTLVARGIYNAISQFSGQIKSVAENGMEAAKAGEEIAAKWSNLGISTDGVQKLAAQVALLKENSNLTGQAVANMQTRFYDQTHSVEETQKLAQGVASLADQLKMTQSQADGFSAGLARIESAGKVTRTSLGRLEKQAPGLTTALQQASGMSQDAFSKLVSSGKMTANQFNDILSKAGNNFNENAKKFNETSDGASHHLQTVWADTQKKLMTPLVKVEATGLSSLSKALDNAQTQNAVNELGRGLANVAENLTKGVDYLVAHEKDIGSSVDSVYKITKYFGEGAWSVASGMIKGVSNAFGDLSGKSKGSDDILDNVASALKGIESHKSAIETVGKIAAGVWIAEKAFGVLNSTVGFVNTTLKTLDTIGGGIKWAASVLGIKSETKALQEQNAVLMENNALSSGGGSVSKVGNAAETVESDLSGVERGAGKEGGLLNRLGGRFGNIGGKLGGLTRAGKLLGGGVGLFDVINSGMDLIGTNKHNVGDHVGGAVGNLGGAAAGAAIGTALLPGIGTAIGAGIGGLGGDKIGREIGKSIQKGLSGSKIHVPTISMKSSLSKLESEYKSYYSNKQKQDEKDIKTLYKNGDISKAEYEKRLKQAEDEGNNLNRFEKMSQSDRTAVAKYYAQQRHSIEDTYSSRIQSTKKKWDNKILEDENHYGMNSIQVQRDEEKKSKAVKELEYKEKSAINKLTLKDATSTTVAEARLHTTLNGKIQLAADKQKDILTRLTKDKGKLSNQQLQTAVNEAQKEYKETVNLADKKEKDTFKAAYKQYQEVTKAATRQRKEAISAANDQYKNTVAAANRQFKGHSQWAEQQRKAVINKARDQRNQSTNAAWDQYNKTVDHAQKQQSKVDDAARKQHDTVISHARDQRNQVNRAASDQSKGVITHARRQANHSSSASGSLGRGLQSIWKNILSFFRGLVKPFGVKVSTPKERSYAGTNYGDPSYGTYANGGIVSASRALVGEAGVEARYQPYSGKIDFLGTHGAEIVSLNPGDHILNARDTAKLFNGGLGHTMPGYASGTDSLGSFMSSISKGAINIWDNVSSAAQDALSKITNPVKTLTGIADKVFNINSTDSGSVSHDAAHGMVKTGIDAIGNFIQKLINSMSSGSVELLDTDHYDFKAMGADSGADPWGYFYKECVSYVADMLSKAGAHGFSHLGNAIQWGTHGSSHHTPHVGDVAWFNGSSYGVNPAFGHVAMVRGIHGGQVDLSQYNIAGKHSFDKSTIPISWVAKFLDFGQHFGGSGTQPSGSHEDWLREAGIHSHLNEYNYIINHESGWDPHATNPSSGAYGLPQSLPGAKMASAGGDWRNNPITQLRWMKSYVDSAYGGISNAYHFWLSHHAYANGGLATTPSIFGEAGAEIAIPWADDKKPRAMELLDQTAQHFTGKSLNVNQDNSKVEELLDQNNKLTNLVTNLLSAILGETQKANQPLSDLVKNRISKDVINRYGRSIN
ncbi:tape measure protein [Oenococcus alcoholitolerans]|uniref:aggregation-promoting factor C-terminal-like domain-containing protein n=1 Tax=Oenococcus alcoholitolerans TaxID=931074 RepID=UPI003F708F1A